MNNKENIAFWIIYILFLIVASINAFMLGAELYLQDFQQAFISLIGVLIPLGLVYWMCKRKKILRERTPKRTGDKDVN